MIRNTAKDRIILIRIAGTTTITTSLFKGVSMKKPPDNNLLRNSDSVMLYIHIL
jgi:hypothetical protein